MASGRVQAQVLSAEVVGTARRDEPKQFERVLQQLIPILDKRALEPGTQARRDRLVLVEPPRHLCVRGRSEGEYGDSVSRDFCGQAGGQLILCRLRGAVRRQKSSGFGYPPNIDHKLDAVVSAAIARHDSAEAHAAVVHGLLEEYREALVMHDALAGELAQPG